MSTSLIDSINAIASESFNCPQGAFYDVILDPREGGKVYTFLNTGSTPFSVYHKIDIKLFKVYKNSIPQSVVNCLLSKINHLENALVGFFGTEINSQGNAIGLWHGNSLLALESVFENVFITSYWEPSEWFASETDNFYLAWMLGKTAEQIVDEQHLGNEADGICNREDAIAYVDELIKEWKSGD